MSILHVPIKLPAPNTRAKRRVGADLTWWVRRFPDCSVHELPCVPSSPLWCLTSCRQCRASNFSRPHLHTKRAQMVTGAVRIARAKRRPVQQRVAEVSRKCCRSVAIMLQKCRKSVARVSQECCGNVAAMFRGHFSSWGIFCTRPQY